MKSPSLRNHRRTTALVPIALAGALGLTALASAQTTVQVPATPPAREALRAPAPLRSNNGVLDQRLDAVFGVATIATPAGKAEITVRAYAPPRAANALPTASIPGPTLTFHPGDLLRIRFENQLNATANPALNAFDNNIQQVGGTTGAFDDIREHTSHEISIPNDSNVTNLHVHGLHVDPKQDNVTLLILPKDYSPGNLSPELQRFVPTINRWWTRAYQYKIPADHIPGTYWYHSHKHGSTSTQVENGMAGTLVMLPRNPQDDIVPSISGTAHDRVLMVQEITNFGTPSDGGGASSPDTALRAAGKTPGSGKGKAAKGKGKSAKSRLLTNNAVVPPASVTNANGAIVTVNGQSQPTLKLPPNQVERWRLIIAGANHTAAGSFWVGKYVLPAESALPAAFTSTVQAMQTLAQAQAYYTGNSPTPFPAGSAVTVTAQAMAGDVKLATVDGIPIRTPVDIGPAAPTLGGSGNRFDLFVRPAATIDAGPYYLFQNYPVPPQSQLAAAYPDLFGPGVDAKYGVTGLAAARYAAVATGTLASGVSPLQPFTDAAGNKLPNNLQNDTYALGTNYQGFTPTWFTVEKDGTPKAANANNPVTLPVAPLLRAKPRANGAGVEIEEPANTPATTFPNGSHQPMPDAGDGLAPTAAVLMVVDTSGPAVNPPTDPMKDFASRVSALSPAGTATMLKRVTKAGQLVPGIPAYVSPFTAPVSGNQVAVFDRGQFTFDYTDKVTGQVQQFRQFWINGRQFDIDDSIGNPAATSLIQKPLVNVEPSLGEYNPSAAASTWTHQVAPAVGADGQPKIIVTNPAYYRPIKPYTLTNSSGKSVTGYNYDYSSYTPPTSSSLSGLPKPPSMPKSRTSEEWILVNNSDLYHPFHIHISPFFVEEVGQLNYTPPPANAPQGTVGKWNLNRTVWNGTAAVSVPATGKAPNFGWVVGAWWDTIMMPPHGYIRFKTWINVPDQVPTNPNDPFSDLVVVDDSNTYGSWVFHCHILRHEDRGMMSMVNTVPNPVVLAPTWYDNKAAGAVQYAMVDAHGALRATASTGGAPLAGTFNEGLGNPFVAQPYAGAMKFAAGTATFCATSDAQLLVFSNGAQWTTNQAAPAYPAPSFNYIDLSGKWTDDTETANQATIAQTKTASGTATLTFTPVTQPNIPPVWWSSSTGAWNAGVPLPIPNTNPQQTSTVLSFGGSATFVRAQAPGAGQNQLLSFCVTSDGKKIVFSNGVTWTKN